MCWLDWIRVQTAQRARAVDASCGISFLERASCGTRRGQRSAARSLHGHNYSSFLISVPACCLTRYLLRGGATNRRCCSSRAGTCWTAVTGAGAHPGGHGAPIWIGGAVVHLTELRACCETGFDGANAGGDTALTSPLPNDAHFAADFRTHPSPSSPMPPALQTRC